MNCEPRILFATDRNYLQHTIVTLTSILVHLDPKAKLYVYVLSEDLTENDQAGFISLQHLHPFELNFIHVELRIFKSLTSMRNSRMTYARLLSPYLFPDLEKILYLDSDLIFESDVAELWNTDLKGRMFAAVPDNPYRMKSRKKQLKIPDKKTYVNGGVLILDLNKMRSENAWKRIQAFIDKWSTRALKYHDQDLLNSLFYDDILLLEYKWNFIAMYASSRKYCAFFSSFPPAVIHFAGASAPWSAFCRLRYSDRYFHYRKIAGLPEIERKRTLRDFILYCLPPSFVQPMFFLVKYTGIRFFYYRLTGRQYHSLDK